MSVLVQPNSTVQEGTAVSFECMHDLNITPSVIWSKDGEQIPSFRSPQEYIPNITRSHTGFYSCKIMKNENQGIGNVSLDILCKYFSKTLSRNKFKVCVECIGFERKMNSHHLAKRMNAILH